ncbi:ParB/RepB/Spo0J family partition protein [Aliivibrio fischeri]|uniref:ParB/RepB/Spo0J family partition protein n=1 Tax=Aliivibrio fischeri TaxID=668 RepID=UPI0018C58368|nr:ParB N-terminal domain-containing protein [Aliivibrio fischeri]
MINTLLPLADSSTFMLPLKRIKPLSCGGNARKKRPEKAFLELKNKIKVQGLLQNVVVREVASTVETGTYELVAGYGRFRAFIELSSEFPTESKYSSIGVKNLGLISDREAIEAQLTENLNRSDLTIIDNIELSKGYLSYCDGDYETAASRLGYSDKVFRDYLQMSKASSKVLEALEKADSPIKKGHVLILSCYSEDIQNNSLIEILKNPNLYTVAYLKKKAESFKLDLNEAKFSVQACEVCQHNSAQQFSVFDEISASQYCLKSSCYLEKSQEWLENTRIPELKEKSNTVLTTDQKPIADVRMLRSELLGEQQFNSCSGCESNAILVNTQFNNFGNAVSNVCIDTECFAKNVKRHSDLIKKQENLIIDSKDLGAESKDNKTNAILAKSPSVIHSEQPVKKISARLSRTYENQAQRLAAKNVFNDSNFPMAVLIKTFSNSLDYENRIKEEVWDLASKTSEELKELTTQLMNAFCNQTVSLDSNETRNFNQNKILRNTMLELLEPKKVKMLAVKDWVPTKEILNMYVMPSLYHIANESGFIEFYDTENGPESFNKMFNQSKKSDLITLLLKSKFNWDHYAPKEFVDIALTKSKH